MVCCFELFSLTSRGLTDDDDNDVFTPQGNLHDCIFQWELLPSRTIRPSLHKCMIQSSICFVYIDSNTLLAVYQLPIRREWIKSSDICTQIVHMLNGTFVVHRDTMRTKRGDTQWRKHWRLPPATTTISMKLLRIEPVGMLCNKCVTELWLGLKCCPQ